MFEFTKMNMDELRTVTSAAKPQRWECLVETIEEILIAEGRAIGEAEELAKGQAKGQTKTIIRYLGRRFGPASPDAEGWILAASATDLETWLDAILDARDLEAVFAHDLPH